jgi:hypothetical protein
MNRYYIENGTRKKLPNHISFTEFGKYLDYKFNQFRRIENKLSRNGEQYPFCDIDICDYDIVNLEDKIERADNLYQYCKDTNKNKWLNTIDVLRKYYHQKLKETNTKKLDLEIDSISYNKRTSDASLLTKLVGTDDAQVYIETKIRDYLHINI